MRWMFRVKFNLDGSIHKYKVRLNIKEYVQLFGIDYRYTFALVACMNIIDLIITIAAQLR